MMTDIDDSGGAGLPHHPNGRREGDNVELVDDENPRMLTTSEVKTLKQLARDYHRARWLVASLLALGGVIGGLSWLPDLMKHH